LATPFFSSSSLRRALIACVVVCLLGIQLAGLVHRFVHPQTAPFETPTPLQLLAAKAHSHDAHAPWIVEFGHAACLHGNECAAMDQLLLAAALVAASFVLTLLAAHHSTAVKLALARSGLRPRTQRARGPPR
jgi:hypothetical protein